MTKADLKRLDELYKLTGDAINHLSGLRATYGLSGCNFSGAGHSGAVGCPTEDTAIAIEAAEQEIEQYNAEMRRIISTIRPKRGREAFEKLYVDRMKWSQILSEMELTDDRNIRRRVSDIKKNPEKFDFKPSL